MSQAQIDPSLSSKEEATEDVLFEDCLGWLERVVNSCRASAGLVMIVSEGQTGLQAVAGWPAEDDQLERLGPLVQQAVRSRRPMQERKASTVQLALPVSDKAELLAIAAFEFSADVIVSAKTVEALNASCNALAGFVWKNRLNDMRAQAAYGQFALEILAAVGNRRGFHDAATGVANEIRARLSADRVSIGVPFKKNKSDGALVRVVAVSDTAHVQTRASLATSLANVMAETLDLEHAVTWPRASDIGGVLPVAHRAHTKNEGAGQCLLSLPMWGHLGPTGVLCLEFFQEIPPRSLSRHRAALEPAARLLGPVLELKTQQNRWISGRLTDIMKQVHKDMFHDARPSSIMIGLGVLAVLLFAFVPVPQRVTADATVFGAAQRALTAPFDGFIDSVNATAGDTVAEGQILAQLQDDDLRLEISSWNSRTAELAQERRVALAENNRVDVGLIDAQLGQARAELALARLKRDQAEILSPVAGMVVDGDLRQKIGAPVRQGEVLFEITHAGDFRLDILVSEQDISLIEAGQQGQVLLADGGSDFFAFEVKKVRATAETKDGQNGFVVDAVLHGAPLGIRPGLEGLARIDVGRGPAGAVWTRGLRNWALLFFWSWAP